MMIILTGYYYYNCCCYYYYYGCLFCNSSFSDSSARLRSMIIIKTNGIIFQIA